MNLAKKGTEDAVVLLSRKDFINLHNVERLGIGCDLTAQKDGVEYKIEVKATRTKGIPDAFENEFEFDNLGKRVSETGSEIEKHGRPRCIDRRFATEG